MQLIANSHPSELPLGAQNEALPFFGTWVTFPSAWEATVTSALPLSLTPHYHQSSAPLMCARSKHPAAVIVFAIQMSSSLPPQDANIQIWKGASVRQTPPPLQRCSLQQQSGPAPRSKVMQFRVIRFRVPLWDYTNLLFPLTLKLLPPLPLPRPCPASAISFGRGTVASVTAAAVSQKLSQ